MVNNSYQAALFDLDGVVFDTESQYSIFWGGQGKIYHPAMSDFAQRIKGQTLEQIYDGYFSDGLESEREIITQRLNAFEAHMNFPYIAGFQQFVTQLRERGLKTAVVTSSNQAKMEQVYAKRPEFRSFFDEILTAEDFAASKPDPDCYLTAARRFGVAPAHCLVFEDSINGLKSGKAAGMTLVGLSTTNPAEVVSAWADKVMADYQDNPLQVLSIPNKK